MRLSTLVARRYLFAEKSHNVINIISLISGIGIAVGTCALIIVMSVYNGFENIVKGVYQGMEADFIISPVSGKCFSPNCAAIDSLRNHPATAELFEVVSERAFATYDDAQSIVFIKGVDTAYLRHPAAGRHIIDGEFKLYDGEIPSAIVGKGIARQMRLAPRFVTPLEIYLPSRLRNISLIDPMSSLNKIRLFPSGIISLEQNADDEIIYIPISLARQLTEYDDEVSYLELFVGEGVNTASVEKNFRSILGDDYVLKNRYQQNEMVYKMMKYEKAAIYAILLFIILIISCNVFGSLMMLIIEKKDDIGTLRSLGARDSLLKSIFIQEGWMITLYGAAAGCAAGILLTLVQQIFGIIEMPGNFLVQSYPVSLKFTDIVISVASVAAIGFVIACIPAGMTFKNNPCPGENRKDLR